MNISKQIFIVTFILLTACAPRPPVNEAVGNSDASPIIGSATKPKALTLAERTSPQTTVTIKNNEKIKTSPREEEPETTDTTLGKNKRQGVASSVSKISSWEISGAMAARSKNKGWSASLNWVQRGANQYQIRLSGPLGSGTILISKSGGMVTLRDGPKTVSSSNASTLLKQQTGISLPVNNLYYWARGIPAPGYVQSEKRDQAGRLTLLRQAGYTIQYLGYTSAGTAVLPKSVRLQGNGIFIKLVINRWKV